MRYNERELIEFSQTQSNWEGKLKYRPPKTKTGSKLAGILSVSSGDEERERWFRLRANCLFYFRLNQTGGRPPFGAEPLGVLILERFHVQAEGFETPNAFSVIFNDDNGEKKHTFIAENERHVKQWVTALKGASYQELRTRLVNLQIKLREKTNCDPLRGTSFENNPLFCPTATEAYKIDFCQEDCTGGDPPKPKPRKPKSKGSFQSHVVENWENHSPHNIKQEEDSKQAKKLAKQPSFQSHVPTGNLINF